MLIRELESKTGLDRGTIRFYEQEGFIRPTRKENGYREYSDDIYSILLKIKVLRQLGMSLDKIRQLQAGSASLSEASEEQLRLLDHHIQKDNQAKLVCQEMQNRNEQFDSMDAAYYLRILQEDPSREAQQKLYSVPEFSEQHTQPKHPVRRFLARYLDRALLGLLLEGIVIVLLRIRPVDDFLQFLIALLSILLLIPTESIMLHLFGTTPGKWLSGIRIESCDGGNLSRKASFDRTIRVMTHGVGWYIPIYSIYRMHKSYRMYTEEGRTLWDDTADILYAKQSRTQAFIRWMIAFLLLGALNGMIALDLIKPQHRGNGLSVAEFADNYNYYRYMNEEIGYKMDDNGQFIYDYHIENGQIVSFIMEKSANLEVPCTYTTENGQITRIKYEQIFTDSHFMPSVAGSSDLFLLTIVLSQPGTGLRELLELEDLLQKQGRRETGEFSFRNLTVRWETDAENAQYIVEKDFAYYLATDGKPTRIHIQFEIDIQQPNPAVKTAGSTFEAVIVSAETNAHKTIILLPLAEGRASRKPVVSSSGSGRNRI